jgi:membrane protein DedA with SNARE-associated domain
MNDLNSFLELYGLAAIFGIMLAKSIGIPIPIPADALMLATSARVAAGKFALGQAFIALLIALIIGGVIQFELVQKAGRTILYRYGKYLGMTPARLDSAAARLAKGGTTGIGLAILTPGVRSVAVIGSGLAGIPIRRFIPGLALGSSLFLALHFFLGYVGGSILNSISTIIPIPVLVVTIVLLVIIGLGVWIFIRRRQMPDSTTREVVAQAVGSWHEATCPVCLALGAANRLQIHLDIEHDHQHEA